MRRPKQEPEVVLAKASGFLAELRCRLRLLGWSEDDIAAASVNARKNALESALQPGTEDWLIY
jgi:hypothetical protein